MVKKCRNELHSIKFIRYETCSLMKNCVASIINVSNVLFSHSFINLLLYFVPSHLIRFQRNSRI